MYDIAIIISFLRNLLLLLTLRRPKYIFMENRALPRIVVFVINDFSLLTNLIRTLDYTVLSSDAPKAVTYSKVS